MSRVDDAELPRRPWASVGAQGAQHGLPPHADSSSIRSRAALPKRAAGGPLQDRAKRAEDRAVGQAAIRFFNRSLPYSVRLGVRALRFTAR